MTDESHPKWIDTLATVASKLGMNATQVRWRLIRWHDKPMREKVGAPKLSITAVLALAILATYARVWMAQGGGFSSPPRSLLLDFGANDFTGDRGEPWRLLTSIFLHAGLMHLAFNLIALAQVGPPIEEIWGRLGMLVVFIATGLISSIGSSAMHANEFGLGVGASGAICGLIGAAAGYGQRLGTPRGIELRNSMLRWLAYVIVFGFAVKADNWAHGFGAVAGGSFGFALKPALWNKRAFAPFRWLLQLVAIACTIGAVALVLTRTVSAPPTAAQLDARICDVYRSGDPAKALLLLQRDFVPAAGGEAFTVATVAANCKPSE